MNKNAALFEDAKPYSQLHNLAPLATGGGRQRAAGSTAMPVCPCGRCARGDLRAVDGKLTKISFFTTSRTPTQQNSIRILEGKATRPADLVSGQAQLCATAAASAGGAECERRSRLAPHSGKTKIPQNLSLPFWVFGLRSPLRTAGLHRAR